MPRNRTDFVHRRFFHSSIQALTITTTNSATSWRHCHKKSCSMRMMISSWSIPSPRKVCRMNEWMNSIFIYKIRNIFAHDDKTVFFPFLLRISHQTHPLCQWRKGPRGFGSSSTIQSDTLVVSQGCHEVEGFQVGMFWRWLRSLQRHVSVTEKKGRWLMPWYAHIHSFSF